MVKQLSTIEEVISELGGPRAVAELTNRGSVSAVPTWKLRKSFPTNTYAVMKAALEAKGFAAPDHLWGMEAAERAAS
jgi:hypothetical protein